MTDVDRILNFVNQECDALAEMECVLTEKETTKLLTIYPCDSIISQLRKMNNYPKIRKNNRSVYLTCLKWFESDIAKGYYKPEEKNRFLHPSEDGFRRNDNVGTPSNVLTCDEVYRRQAEFLERFPPGIGFRTASCEGWRVVNRRIVERDSDSKIMTIAEFVAENMLEK